MKIVSQIVAMLNVLDTLIKLSLFIHLSYFRKIITGWKKIFDVKMSTYVKMLTTKSSMCKLDALYDLEMLAFQNLMTLFDSPGTI